MAPSIADAWQSFWHTMTSYDRHASHNSPFKTGQHVPLGSNRHAPLTSVATSGIESRADLNSPYFEDSPSSRANLHDFSNGYPGSPGAAQSPSSPYTPGLRSSSVASNQRKQPSAEPNPFEGVGSGEIQLQNFQEGLPPPPPVTHSWKRIDRWAEENYQELFDQLGQGATNNDLNELEHTLDCSLPLEVRESLGIHDGQERGGTPTGILFGCMLLDCEEVVQEWQNWKVVNQEYLSELQRRNPQMPSKAFGGNAAASSSSSSAQMPVQQSSNSLWKQDLNSRQDSQPPNAVQKVYAHPAWIPLARDWGGNNLAVDLAPGPIGTWGQVIIFGRDYDCKYVVARSWAAFLAMVADDLSSEKWYVEEESNELKLREFKTTTVEPAYLDILRWRMDQKYGRKGPRRKNSGPRPGSGHGAGSSSSPYTSPTAAEMERGRSPQRFSSGAGSPRSSIPRPSPLAKVTEEATSTSNLMGDVGVASPSSTTSAPTTKPTSTATSSGLGKLVEADTPVDSSKSASQDAQLQGAMPSSRKQSVTSDVQGLGVEGIDRVPDGEGDDELKQVDL